MIKNNKEELYMIIFLLEGYTLFSLLFNASHVGVIRLQNDIYNA